MFTIDKDLCIRCRSCVKVCPLGIFTVAEDGSVAPAQKECLDCFHCTATCPVRAITYDGMDRAACYPDPAPEGTLLAKLQQRRSIRHFKSAIPDRAVIQAALDGAAYAPSGHNERPYRWTVVLGHERVDHIRRLVLDWAKDEPEFRHLVWADRRGRDPITCGAPCLIFAHVPRAAITGQPDGIIAAALAEQLLADAGLGVCWGGYLCRAVARSADLRAALELPEDREVCSVLMVGYSDERYPNLPPRPAASVCWLE